MSKPEVFITLDQFKVLAARITAKERFIREKIERWIEIADNLELESSEVGYGWASARLADLSDLLEKPADSFFAVCEVDMQQPEKHQPTQLELFGKEFC